MSWPIPDLKLSAIIYDNGGSGLSRSGSNFFDGLHNIHPLDDTSKDNVLSVEPCGLGGAQEELRSVGIGSGVGHGQNSGTGVRKCKVLVCELGSVDGFSTCSVVVGEITSLAHESGDDTVETGSLESESLFSGTQSTEILGGFGDYIGSQLHDDTASGFSADGDIEKYLGLRPKWRSSRTKPERGRKWLRCASQERCNKNSHPSTSMFRRSIQQPERQYHPSRCCLQFAFRRIAEDTNRVPLRNIDNATVFSSVLGCAYKFNMDALQWAEKETKQLASLRRRIYCLACRLHSHDDWLLL